MEKKRPNFIFSSKKVTIGRSKMASIPEIANDQMTPPNKSKARFSIKMTDANKQPSSNAPAKQATNPRNFRCLSERIGEALELSFMYLFLLFSCLSLHPRIDIN
jgi:hypothetical protein